MKYYFHIDVNSAYLSWQAAYMLSQGYPQDIRKFPSVIGGDQRKRKGIVLAKSIPAKKYNIQTGESLHEAKRKCPVLQIFPPNYQLYMQASQAMVDLLYHYSPNIQRFSIDEVFLDLYGDVKEVLNIAENILWDIESKLGFTVNIGISENKLLAKMASDFKKPNQIHTLFKDEISKKMWPLPVEKLFMVGSRTKRKLNSRGIRSIGDLANLSGDYIYDWLKKPGLTIWNYANGREDSTITIDRAPVKSLGNSTTTPYDITTTREAEMFLLAISEKLAMRLRSIHKRAQVISVRISDHEFISYRKEQKIPIATHNTNRIYQIARQLFHEIFPHKPIRRFSIGVSSFICDEQLQLSFFHQDDADFEKLDLKIDQLRNEYGHRILQRSIFLHSGIAPIIGGVLEEEEYLLMTSVL
ncbi:MAG: DNA polymerase IV [Tissierellia bacterium]|nr:DNA polymerase IV [Tissierellia bacterium]